VVEGLNQGPVDQRRALQPRRGLLCPPNQSSDGSKRLLNLGWLRPVFIVEQDLAAILYLESLTEYLGQLCVASLAKWRMLSVFSCLLQSAEERVNVLSLAALSEASRCWAWCFLFPDRCRSATGSRVVWNSLDLERIDEIAGAKVQLAEVAAENLQGRPSVSNR